MGENVTYYISCWNCSASFNAMDATFCSHSDPSVLCLYCFKCSCEAPEYIKKEIEDNAPPQFLLRKKEAKSGGERKLGDILFNSGKISEEELAEAIRIHRSSNRKMGEIFVEMGILKTDELELYLIGQRSKEKTDLENFIPDLDLAEKVGLNLCLRRNIVPLEYNEIDDKKVLKIAITSPDVFRLIRESGELSEYILIPCYSEEENIEKVIKKIKHYAEVGELILLK